MLRIYHGPEKDIIHQKYVYLTMAEWQQVEQKEDSINYR